MIQIRKNTLQKIQHKAKKELMMPMYLHTVQGYYE